MSDYFWLSIAAILCICISYCFGYIEGFKRGFDGEENRDSILRNSEIRSKLSLVIVSVGLVLVVYKYFRG